MPIELFQKSLLLRLGDLVGKAVKVDPTTLLPIRGKFVRMCVEFDLGEPLVPFVSVMGYLQPLENECLHQVCFRCGKHGHKNEFCPSLSRPKESPAEADAWKPPKEFWLVDKVVCASQRGRLGHNGCTSCVDPGVFQ